MPYEIEKMPLPDIKILYEVLEEIRKTCSTRNNDFVIWGKDKKTENVSSNDLIHIIGTLHGGGYLKRYGLLSAFVGTSFNVITKNFEPFYYAVAKRLNILEQRHQAMTKPEEEILSPDFNSQTGILFFQNKKIQMTLKNQKSNAHFVLEHIFASEDEFDDGIGRQFDYADIAEQTFNDDFSSKNSAWRKYYRACENIQKKVREATKIEDFLIFTQGKSGWVKINEKYLE